MQRLAASSIFLVVQCHCHGGAESLATHRITAGSAFDQYFEIVLRILTFIGCCVCLLIDYRFRCDKTVSEVSIVTNEQNLFRMN